MGNNTNIIFLREEIKKYWSSEWRRNMTVVVPFLLHEELSPVLVCVYFLINSVSSMYVFSFEINKFSGKDFHSFPYIIVY